LVIAPKYGYTFTNQFKFSKKRSGIPDSGSGFFPSQIWSPNPGVKEAPDLGFRILSTDIKLSPNMPKVF
jgi:hypothetical protein